MSQKKKDYSVVFFGRVEWPEDDPIYGSYWSDHIWCLGGYDELICVVKDAESKMSDEAFFMESEDLYGRPLSFSIKHVRIIINKRQTLLSASVQVDHALLWNEPVTDAWSIELLKTIISEIQGKASYEAGWDNFSTAKNLRSLALKLDGLITEPEFSAQFNELRDADINMQPLRELAGVVKSYSQDEFLINHSNQTSNKSIDKAALSEFARVNKLQVEGLNL